MRCELSTQIKFDSFRNFKPAFAGSHACGHIRTAHTGGESVQRSVRARMGVRTDDAFPRSYDPLLRKQGMLDSHFPDIVKVLDVLRIGKGTACLALLCCLDILVWRKMIHNHADFSRIKHL